MIRLLMPLAFLSLAVAGCSGNAPDTGATNTATEENIAAPAPAPEVSKPLPDVVRVRLDTAEGPITLDLDAKHAPITTKNFVRYVEAGRFDGTEFYRAARTKGNEKEGFIQGGIRRSYRRMFPPIAHEPTTKTGLHHEAGTISMAYREPGYAMGDFFIMTKAMPEMDAKGDKPGFAAFGKVVDGMATVRKILASPTIPGGEGAMKGQMIEQPVKIVAARRVE
jgi:peptidyl-prolyl cis-trans isomerase A (cyclophilin A)